MIGPLLVYLLCFVTCAVCTFLLARAYRRTGMRLLFWCALCFFFLTINNALVLIDVIPSPETNLLAYRQIASFAAVAVLIHGFMWEIK
ncbi:DUF5985 family protein [Candidatus Viadribacter manganicus]|uniref:Uncharacterized protein n=1 Tax=Candidatus Viadribacter manganicus TaxID=1759059 RepID=A0A1B1AJ66_9PROT|nr:DUF5985 family protein [Candidatus Viadribacter manganicus]ANP46591.1 hypothetical protein ATE48_12025 [Candidatus Viadribacter manganicus]